MLNYCMGIKKNLKYRLLKKVKLNKSENNE